MTINIYDKMKKILQITLILLLVGCSANSVKAPTPQVTYERWKEAEINAKGRTDKDWWKNFGDQNLEDIISLARENNFDMKIAKARINQARAEQHKVLGTNLPALDFSPEISRRRDSSTLSDRPVLRKFSNNFRADFDATWEIDVFGIEPSYRASKENSAKMREDYNATLVSLYGDVATNYFEVRKLQAELDILKQKSSEISEQVKLQQSLVDSGKMDEITLSKTKARAIDINSQIEIASNNLKQEKYLLEGLVGVKPGELEKYFSEDYNLAEPKQKILFSAPSTVLANRPDVRSAERNLAYTNALKDVAVSDLFPKISITGLLGYESGRESTLIDPKSRVFRIAGGLTAPIFNYNLIRSNIMEADAKAEEALANYEKSINNSLIDVESAFAGYNSALNNVALVEKSTQESQAELSMETEKYNNGKTSYLASSEAKLNLLDKKSRLNEVSFEKLKQTVRVYKALGGGW